MIKRWLAIILFFIPLLAQAENAKLTGIQIAKTNNATRISVTLNHPVSYHLFTLSKPDRLILDLKNTRLSVRLKDISTKNSGISEVRSGHPELGILRLVFDTNMQSRVKIISERKSSRLIVDVFSATPPPQTLAKPARVTVIVIDPGHGGKDPGAIGMQRTMEKNVVLAISKQLADIINRQPNMRAVLTRKDDYFVPLYQRLTLARKGKADLFIAIHADGYFNNHASGASVYALSQHGATSTAARWLAQRENHSELGGVDLKELGDQSYLLRSVLIDLAQTATINDSLRLGTTLLDTLENMTTLHYSRVEQAPFMVLKSPDIPSVLVETGFISNAREEQRLRDKNYQKKMAAALFDGLQLYLKKYSSLGV